MRLLQTSRALHSQTLSPRARQPLLLFVILGTLGLLHFAGCSALSSSRKSTSQASCKRGTNGCVPETTILGSGPTRRARSAILYTNWRKPVDPNRKGDPWAWKLTPEESASPLYDAESELVYVGGEKGLFTCRKIRGGKLVWTVKLQGRIVSRPVIRDEFIYVGTTGGVLYALDRYEGKKSWEYPAKGELLSQPATAEEVDGKLPPLVLFNNSNNQLIALHAKTGKWQWQYRRDPPDQLSIRGQAPPLVHGGVVYTGFSDGYVVAVKRKDGSKIWSRSLKKNERFPDIDSPLTLHNDTLFAASYSGSLYALNSKTGTTRWQYRLIGASQAVVHEKYVYVSNTNGKIASLHLSNGKPHWKKAYHKASSFNDPVVNDKYIFLTSTNNGLYVLDRSNGKVIQIVRFGTGFSSPATLQGKFLHVFSNASFLYQFSLQKPQLVLDRSKNTRHNLIIH